MGSMLDRFKKGGGGYLNNVDGTIASLVFTSTRPDSRRQGVPPTLNKDGEMRANSKSIDFTPLFVRALIDVDGKDEQQETHLMAGDGAQWTISKNGKTVTPRSEDAQFWGGVEWHKFLTSVVEAGYDESQLPTLEPGEPVTFDMLEGERFRFVQRRDEEKTTKLGKRKDAKTGREYDRTYLAVAKYYGANGNGNGAVQGAMEETNAEIAELGKKTLLKVLRLAKGGTIKYADLKLKVTTALMGTPLNDQKSEIRAWLEDEDNLKKIPGVAYDQTDKNRPISLET